MRDRELDRLQSELLHWRARIEHARLQESLGREAAGGDEHELERHVEQALRRARPRLQRIAAKGDDGARVRARSLRAAWEHLPRLVRGHAQETE